MGSSLLADTDTQKIEEWVFQEKIKMLYANHRHSWHFSLLVSGIIASFSFQSDQFVIGITWWLSFVLITLVRTRVTQKFFDAPEEAKNYDQWHKYFFWLAALAGTGWCLGGLLVGAPLDAINQIIILLVLIGVCAAAVPMLGLLQNVMLAFQIPAVVPYLAWLAYNLEDKAVILTLVLVVYIAGVVISMRRVEECINKSLRVQYRMEKMADSLHESNQELQDENEKLEHMSFEDSLTQLYNRRYFEMHLEKEWKRATRKKTKLTLVVVDIDYFKLFNDTYGHVEGDECLKKMAEILKKSLHRPGDIIARIGGEEFVALLPEIDEKGALIVAEAMQKRLNETAITHATSPVSDHVTVSIGIASAYSYEAGSALGLFKAADKALYKSKTKGRNQIVIGELDVVVY
jgi:diguanylate cyclase (GGDEF)-like protein